MDNPEPAIVTEVAFCRRAGWSRAEYHATPEADRVAWLLVMNQHDARQADPDAGDPDTVYGDDSD